MKTRHLTSLRILAVLTWLIVGSVASGQPDDGDLRTAFRQVYERYEAAVSASDLDTAAAAAEEALRLGIELFGETHPNTANLRQNHALMLELQGFPDEAETEYLAALDILDALETADPLAAVQIFIRLSGLDQGVETQAEYLRRALAIQRAAAPDDMLAYADLAVDAADLLSTTATGRPHAADILRPVLDELEDLHGEDSPRLVPVLLALGRADANIYDDDLHLRWARRAVDITEQAFPNDALARANVAIEVGRDLLRVSRSPSSEPFLEDALGVYEEALGPDDQRTAFAAMWLGEARFGMNRFALAERPLLAALEFFVDEGEFQAEEFRIRMLLSEIYLRTDRSDDATPHLMELGRLSAFSEEHEYLPVYKAAPVYPSRAARLGIDGHVTVEYTVTTTGQTDNVHVIESTSSVFDRAAIESAQRYRYIPRVIDGEPVEVDGVTTTIFFEIEN